MIVRDPLVAFSTERVLRIIWQLALMVWWRSVGLGCAVAVVAVVKGDGPR
jgi:hypothetical protein